MADLILELILGFVGRGEDTEDLRRKISTLKAKPYHLPEETLILDRNRFSLRLFKKYLFAGFGVFWVVSICMMIVFRLTGTSTRSWISNNILYMGKGVAEFIEGIFLLLIITIIMAIPFFLIAAWSRRLLARGILKGVPEEDFRERVLHTKIIFAGTITLLVVILYSRFNPFLLGYFEEPYIEIPILLLLFLLLLSFSVAFGALLLYLCSLLLVKLRGRYSPWG